MKYQDIKSLSQEELRQFLLDNGHKPYRAEQIRTWVFKQKMQAYEGLNVPAELCKLLEGSFSIKSLREDNIAELKNWFKSGDKLVAWLDKEKARIKIRF